MDRTELVDKSFTPRELEKYLDSLPEPKLDLAHPTVPGTFSKAGESQKDHDHHHGPQNLRPRHPAPRQSQVQIPLPLGQPLSGDI